MYKYKLYSNKNIKNILHSGNYDEIDSYIKKTKMLQKPLAYVCGPASLIKTTGLYEGAGV